MYCPHCFTQFAAGDSCSKCSPVAVIERKISRKRFDRNPISQWALRGYLNGMLVGVVAGPVLGLGLALQAGTLANVGIGVLAYSACVGLFFGAIVGPIGMILYQSLVRPILLALFNSKGFEREYGSPEEMPSSTPDKN